MNGGKCVHHIHDLEVTDLDADARPFVCQCPAGYTGDLCETGKTKGVYLLWAI